VPVPSRLETAVRARQVAPPVLPAGAARAPARAGLAFPASLARLDRVALGSRLRLVLPRTGVELEEWGRRLRNCIGSFAAAAAAGSSFMVGVEVEDRLAYCLEMSDGFVIRQFLGTANAVVPVGDARRVLGHLAVVGVLDPSDPANYQWFEAIRQGRRQQAH
jgi:hypothetical protein